MYLKQKDVFWAMDKDFVKEIMNIAESESYQEGDVLFQEGDHADNFYILLKGRVKLILGQTGRVVHVVSNAGETFGWSSLVGRDTYSASAKCVVSAKLLKFERQKLQKVVAKDPANGMVFFKRIAGILGNRLLRSYAMIASAPSADVSTSFGTGQVIDITATELERM
ncbi:MAG: cyclic nucleotide-binding domain-containing protein [Desulfobacterales bacterium]|nr:MAG: cyclic nucleotide-binding domain-containing protein [Desulfobacterales bacterium]